MTRSSLAASVALVLLHAAGAVAASPLPSGSVSPSPSVSSASPVPHLAWSVVTAHPHDPEAFTQGLVLDPDGRLYESTGLLGRSTLREVDPDTGAVLRSVPLPEAEFGEGLALVDDELVQLTWRQEVAHRWDAATFTLVGDQPYTGEGWGLCDDGTRLVMSDGTTRLTFRDRVTFVVLGVVEVTLAGVPLKLLNELECVGGSVWANVWETDTIVRIDPATGVVTGQLDLAGIIDPDPSVADRAAVLNGIAYDAASDIYLVTGKRWPELFRIAVVDG